VPQDLLEDDEDDCFLELDGNRPRKVNLLTIIQVKTALIE